MKNKKLGLILIIVSLAFLVIATISYKKDRDPQPVVQTENTNATVSVKIGDTELTSAIAGDGTVYALMTSLRSEGKLNFIEKEFSGLGVLIEEINGVKNGEGYWLYYLNGEQAQTGISVQKLSPGDTVEWKYEAAY